MKNLWVVNDPLVRSLASRKTKNKALDASNAPVSVDKINPERVGKVLDSWNDEIKMKGPPSDRKRYPGMYASKGRLAATLSSKAPKVRHMLPMMPQTRGPYVSRTVPTGKADTLVATAAIVNTRFRLFLVSLVKRWRSLCVPQLLAVTDFLVLRELVARTQIAIDPFPDQDRFQCRKSEHNSCCEETIDDRNNYLAYSISLAFSRIVNRQGKLASYRFVVYY
jgi:hypothetical protein